MDALKEGLTEKSKVGAVGDDHKRHGDNQVPRKTTETVKKDGKSFKIK